MVPGPLSALELVDRARMRLPTGVEALSRLELFGICMCRYVCVYIIYTHTYLHMHIPNNSSLKAIYSYVVYFFDHRHDSCFDMKRPYFGWLVVQNRGHSRCVCVYIYIM